MWRPSFARTELRDPETVVIATRDASWCDPIETRLRGEALRVVVADDLEHACVEALRPRRLLLVDSLLLLWPRRVRVLGSIARSHPVVLAAATDHLDELVERSFQLGVVGVMPRTAGPAAIAGSVCGLLTECAAGRRSILSEALRGLGWRR